MLPPLKDMEKEKFSTAMARSGNSSQGFIGNYVLDQEFSTRKILVYMTFN